MSQEFEGGARSPEEAEAMKDFNAQQEDEGNGLENPQVEYAVVRAELLELEGEGFGASIVDTVEQAYNQIMKRQKSPEEKVEDFKAWAARERKENHEDEIARQEQWAAEGDPDGEHKQAIEYQQQLLPLFDRLVDVTVIRIEQNEQEMKDYLENLGKPPQLG